MEAQYDNNRFYVKTSRLQSFYINISPEMIDIHKKVRVYLNGKLYFNKKMKYDKKLMLQNFEINKDREQIWINRIKILIADTPV